jgi:hypothetical protein
MAFKMKGPSLYNSGFKQKTTEERLAEIKATRDNLNKVKGSAYNPNKEEKTYSSKDLVSNTSRTVGAADIPGSPGDFVKNLKKLITLDYDQDPVNTKK